MTYSVIGPLDEESTPDQASLRHSAVTSSVIGESTPDQASLQYSAVKESAERTGDRNRTNGGESLDDQLNPYETIEDFPPCGSGNLADNPYKIDDDDDDDDDFPPNRSPPDAAAASSVEADTTGRSDEGLGSLSAPTNTGDYNHLNFSRARNKAPGPAAK